VVRTLEDIKSNVRHLSNKQQATNDHAPDVCSWQTECVNEGASECVANEIDE